MKTTAFCLYPHLLPLPWWFLDSGLKIATSQDTVSQGSSATVYGNPVCKANELNQKEEFL